MGRVGNSTFIMRLCLTGEGAVSFSTVTHNPREALAHEGQDKNGASRANDLIFTSATTKKFSHGHLSDSFKSSAVKILSHITMSANAFTER